MNAYRQRVFETRTRFFDHTEASHPTQRLRINIRSTSDTSPDTFDDEFYFGAVTTVSVPTKAQSIAHLQELVQKYSEWIDAHPPSTESIVEPPTFRMDMLKLSELSQQDSEAGDEVDISWEKSSEVSDKDADGSIEPAPPPPRFSDDQSQQQRQPASDEDLFIPLTVGLSRIHYLRLPLNPF